MKLITLLAFSICWIAGTGQAQADLLETVQRATLDNIQSAVCDLSTKAKCTPATEDERATYPLEPNVSQYVLTSSAQSVAAIACSLDYQKTVFEPMMRNLRSSGRFSERQLAFASLQHGIALGTLEKSNAITCTDKWREFFAKG